MSQEAEFIKYLEDYRHLILKVVFSFREIIFEMEESFFIGVIIIFFLNKFPNKQLQESLEFIRDLNDMDTETKRR